MGEPDLKPVSATACFSMDAWDYIESLPWHGSTLGIARNSESDLAKRLNTEQSYISISGG